MINDKLNENIQKMLLELGEAKKIIGSNRLHFRELEKADFENLKQKNKEHEVKVADMNINNEKLQQFSIQRMQKKIDKNQFNVSKKALKDIADSSNCQHPFLTQLNPLRP